VSARELVSSTSAYLRRHGVPQARLDAELLLAHVLDVERIGLYLVSAGTPSATQCDRHWDLVRQRALQRVPLAYLTGVREFWSQPFWVTRDVLIPRPETETLVEVALAVRPERVLEIGVGSGAVTGALALELPRTRFVAVERSRQALAVARVNLERLGVAARVSLVRGDGCCGLRGPFDLIVSNPPYIPSGELGRLPLEVQNEPTLALDGGPDGLSFVRRLVADAPALLARSGCLVLEVGRGQAGAVREELIRVGAPAIETARDLAGVERVVLARFRED
jgi:release factor glutamine methyltransferase